MTQYMPSVVRMMRRAITDDPEDLDARFTMATALTELGRFREAARELETIVETAPDFESGSAQLLLGFCFIRLRWYAQAIVTFRTAQIHGAAFPETQINLARAYVGLGDHTSAESALASVVEHHDYRGDREIASLVWSEIGKVRFDADDIDGSDTAFFKAARYLPKSVTPYLRRAQFYIERGEPELAVQAVERGERISPHHPDLKVAKTEALIQLGDERRAREIVSTASDVVRNRVRRRPNAWWLLSEDE